MRTVVAGVLVLGLGFTAAADSLYDPGADGRKSLLSRKDPHFAVGDVVTVMVQETIDASTAANTNTKKESDVQAKASAADNTFLVAPKPNGFGLLNQEWLPNWGLEAENEHKSSGTTKRTNRLTTTVSCLVTGVNTNGTIELEGTRDVTVNREDSRLYVRGVARARDVSLANTIPSSQLANATVELRGRGPLWNNQRRGIVTRILDWFSPF